MARTARSVEDPSVLQAVVMRALPRAARCVEGPSRAAVSCEDPCQVPRAALRPRRVPSVAESGRVPFPAILCTRVTTNRRDSDISDYRRTKECHQSTKSRLVLGREPAPAVRADGAAVKSRARTMFPLWHDGSRNGEESRGQRRGGTLYSRDTRFCIQ